MTDPFERAPIPDGLDHKGVVKHVLKTDPRVFFIIFRTLNSNMMVYRALGDSAECFWLVTDPAMRASRRKRGIAHDRESLSMGESAGYGFQYKCINDSHMVTINNVRRPIRLNYSADKKSAKGHIVMEDQRCTIRYAVVHVKGLLNVTHVDLYASTKKKMIKETIQNSKRK